MKGETAKGQTKKPPKGPTRKSVNIRIIRVIRVLSNTELVEVAGVEPASEVVSQWRYYAHSQTFSFIPLAPSDRISRLISGVWFASPTRRSDQLSYLSDDRYRTDTSILQDRLPN